MKKRISLLGVVFIIILSLSACKNETTQKIKNARKAMGNTKDILKNAKNMEKSAAALGDRAEELKQMTPIDNEKFKDWMPEFLDGMPRASFNFQSAMASTGRLEFKSETDDREFHISIIDGAGESGAAVYAFQGFYEGMAQGFESENDHKVEKMEKRKGQSSLETYYKKDNNSEIKTTVSERFMVEAKGYNMNPDEVWKLIEKLKVEKLK